jgi:primosomal protein N' (replication factor Y)
MAIAKVEPLLTARALRGPFDYALPERLAGVGVGSVLVVPFGRQRVVGVVVEVAESSELPPERLAEPLEALEAGATPELVRLGLWVAREYCSLPPAGSSMPPAWVAPGAARGLLRSWQAASRPRSRTTRLTIQRRDHARGRRGSSLPVGSRPPVPICRSSEDGGVDGGAWTTQRARASAIVDVGARSAGRRSAAQYAALSSSPV